ncbi:MAG: DEAD/DEAH box helicase, partial [Limisphaerales bacterium]
MNTSDFSTISPSSEVEEAAFEQALTLSKGLFAHQVEGIAFLLARRRAILADDMGLGKTRQSILALRHAEPTGPYLVLCPASVKWNWVREIRNVDPKAECAVLSGSKEGGAADGFTGWVILNYDILGKRFKELELMEWKGVVFDEAHLLKNHESQRSKLGRRLVLEIAPEAAVHALTGTPLTNRPRDLFPLLQFIRHPLGRSFLSFAKRHCAAEKNDYGWVTDGASNLEELTLQLHGSMLRRRKEDVLDLPPKIRTWVDVEIAPDTAATEIREVFATLVASKADDRPQASRSRLLAKITKAREKIARAKIQSTQDLAESIVAQGEKVIVFSCFDAPIAALTRHFGEAAVTLTGSTPTDKRQALVDRFQQEIIG